MRSTIFALAATAAMAADVSVSWRHEKASGATSVTVHGADDAVLAEACGNSIGSLTFNTEESGKGNCMSYQPYDLHMRYPLTSPSHYRRQDLRHSLQVPRRRELQPRVQR